ncbi:hypothetical protein HAX54_052692, partial [Datura stramonium]|nr:hypothetical protein [Datura stramonium]
TLWPLEWVRSSENLTAAMENGYQKVGLSGIFGIKSHYFPKRERARLRAISSPKLKVLVK